MLLHWLQVLLDNIFTVVQRPRACHTNADSLSRRPDASEVSESDDERALAVVQKENDVPLFDCPFCNDVALSQDGIDHHIDTEHVSKEPLNFTKWKDLQKVKKNSLHPLFESDPSVLQHAQKPLSLTPWRCSSTPTRVNKDDSISYSWDLWVYYQRLDPVLGPAMDTLKNIPLYKQIDRTSLSFVKNGT